MKRDICFRFTCNNEGFCLKPDIKLLDAGFGRAMIIVGYVEHHYTHATIACAHIIQVLVVVDIQAWFTKWVLKSSDRISILVPSIKFVLIIAKRKTCIDLKKNWNFTHNKLLYFIYKNLKKTKKTKKTWFQNIYSLHLNCFLIVDTRGTCTV